MKIIITLRDKDVDGNRNDNSKTVKKIVDFAKKFWNCEEIETKGKEK